MQLAAQMIKLFNAFKVNIESRLHCHLFNYGLFFSLLFLSVSVRMSARLFLFEGGRKEREH